MKLQVINDNNVKAIQVVENFKVKHGFWYSQAVGNRKYCSVTFFGKEFVLINK